MQQLSKQSFLALAAAASCGLGGASAAWAQPAGAEYGRVISIAPVVQQVGTPRQVCTTAQVAEPERKSGAGVVLGAIAGGAAGNAVGNGMGRAAATAAGIIGGALLGSAIEGGSSSGGSSRNVQNCSTQTSYENRTVAYSVVYEYNGKQYSTQMPNDPGQWVQLNIQPVVTGAVSGQVSRAIVQSQQIQPQQVPQQPVQTIPLAPVQQAPQTYAQPAPIQLAPVQLPPTYVQPYSVAGVTTVYGQPVYSSPVYMDAPIQYVAMPYAVRPYSYVAPISLSLGYVYRGGSHRHAAPRRWY